jgi:hypothetical protein
VTEGVAVRVKESVEVVVWWGVTTLMGPVAAPEGT